MPRFLLIFLLCYCSHAVWAADMFSLVTENSAPYYSEDLPEQGFLAEIVKTAAEKQGYAPRLTFTDWDSALNKARTGYYDALLGAYKTDERARWFYFSLPIAKSVSVLFKHKDAHIVYGDLQDLKGYKIGVVRGYAISHAFDEATFLTKVFVDTPAEGFNLLYKKDIDLMAGYKTDDLYRLQHILEPDQPGISENIVVVEPVLKSTAMYVALSKKSKQAEQKLVNLNKGLRTMFLDGTYKQIQEKHGVVID